MKPTFTAREQITDASSARERILYTAHDLFYQNGIKSTGIDKIISESRVTKTTFYRHFSSKDLLIDTYLEYRHEKWIAWFRESLSAHGDNLGALYPTLGDWFESKNFRGCAFINGMGELNHNSTHIMAFTKEHKEALVSILKGMLDDDPDAADIARQIAVAIDGAIIRAQFDQASQPALSILKQMIESIIHPKRNDR